MTETAEDQTAFTMLSVALVPKASIGHIDDASDDIVASFWDHILRVLLDAGAQKLELGGPELVVVLRSPTAALECAFEMQRIFDREISGEIGAGLFLLDIGLHRAPGDADDHWFETTGLHVVTALREISNGRIAISNDFKEAVGGRARVRYHELGRLSDAGDGAPLTVFLVSPSAGAADILGQLTLPFGIPQRGAQVIAAAALLGIAVLFFYFTNGEWGSSTPTVEAKTGDIESIEILRFSGKSPELSAQLNRDSIQNHLITTLEEYDGLRVVVSASSAHSGAADVEAILSGEAEGAGDWMLARARVVRASDETELWRGTYYRRVSEIDSIADSIAGDMARTLGLTRPVADAVQARLGAADGADLEVIRSELEDALLQAQQLELDEPARITSMNNLADLYYDSGRDDEAIPLYEEVIRLREATYGADHPEVAVSMNNLASLYVARGRYVDAEPLYERSLQIRMQALGEKHPRVANAMSNLALLYHRQGRLEEAEALYANALEIRMLEVDMELSPETAKLADRGARFEIDGNYAMAASSYQRALDDETARSGADHARTARVTQRLAVAHQQSGNISLAEALMQRAVLIFSSSVGDNHERTASSMSDLGELYRRNGQIAEARQFHERALTAYENALGVDHPEVAETLGYLVAIFEVEGETEKATEARQRMNEIRSTYLGPVFTYVSARAASRSVIRDRRQDDLNAPQPLHEYRVQVNEGELIKEKRRLAENLHNMALLYLDLGRLEQAEQHALRALDMRRAIDDGVHPEVAINLHAIGRINTFQERYPEAHARYEGALQVFEATLGDIHPYVAATWSDLADLLRRLGLQGQAAYAEDRARQTRAALSAERARTLTPETNGMDRAAITPETNGMDRAAITP